MDYTFTGKITLKTPVMKEFVAMMIERTLKEMNASVIQDQKELPLSVEVQIRK